MLNFLPSVVIGYLVSTAVILSTLLWTGLIVITAIPKLLIPLPFWQRGCSKLITFYASAWVHCNQGIQCLTQTTQWQVEGDECLDLNSWYMVVCNHQSWVDILVLQRVFNQRIPFLKFFLKKQLIWVPILGLAWWALDFPFMHRHSKEKLKKHPELRGKDIAATRKACAHFRHHPISIMNFLEGTRFTQKKHALQHSPYSHLLRPRSGGFAYAFSAMNAQLKTLLNVTIVYPDGQYTFWDFLSGRIKRISVHIEQLQVSEHLLEGDYVDDRNYRSQFHQWVQQLWLDKDQRIDQMLQKLR